MKAITRTGIILTGVVLLAFWYVGYIGGSLFSVMPATDQASPHPRAVALYLSGDMGFHAGLGSEMVTRLNRHGISVVTENSLHFFRTRRTPEQTGAMIAEGLRRAIAIDPAAPLLLLGQSFGADVIAPSLPYVPTPLRKHIAFVGLIAPGATRQWRASPSEIFSIGEPEEDAAVAAQHLSWVPLLCIQGQEERTSLCPSLHQRNAKLAALPGGYALGHDADAASAVLLRAIDTILAGPGQG
ncbi:virulence factor [Sphingobium sp. BYY-5]|uniref:virulence factor n=1 Tax=Sphingobium sp. BYY-5 TaxID=2926400 RepID=UPI001FA73BBF|nr:virulence factor [Sphingobium sp. BYY-5]MCI4591785.1 virulence factor [Sphingobium sp. BYY-5]